MFSKLNFGNISLAVFVLFINGVHVNDATYEYCDNDYNVSLCANTTLNSDVKYVCRGFMSCADSTVDTTKDLYCQGDRSCKNIDYQNSDNDELWSFGYRAADSLKMSEKANDAYCYGYESCIDLEFQQTTDDNDAEAHGYRAMYGSYIDYADDIDVNGYEALYYATINSTSISGNQMDIKVHGYYGSYEADVLCQDGVTCDFYAYGYYATEETYLYCLPGATCNVHCGDTNGCIGMNLLCYSTATCWFDCDDATECPVESDAYSVAALAKLENENKKDKSKKYYTDDDFNKIMSQRLHKKYQKQYEYKQERLREERQSLKMTQKQNNNNNNAAAAGAEFGNNNSNNYLQSQTIAYGIVLIVGMFFGSLVICGYNACVSTKDYQYQSIV